MHFMSTHDHMYHTDAVSLFESDQSCIDLVYPDFAKKQSLLCSIDYHG